jgi:ABC-type sugar transport system ATPase subunit
MAGIELTLVNIVHDQVEVMTVADKIVVMNAGRTKHVGSPRRRPFPLARHAAAQADSDRR